MKRKNLRMKFKKLKYKFRRFMYSGGRKKRTYV